MKFEIIFITARCFTLELKNEGIVKTKPYTVWLNGEAVVQSDRTVQSVFGLQPDTDYTVKVGREDSPDETASVQIHTDPEFVTLNVRDFGAAGDGEKDDTPAIQAAILCCPPQGRVLVPEGIYRIGALFLKSDLRLELEKGAVLSAFTQREKFPILP